MALMLAGGAALVGAGLNYLGSKQAANKQASAAANANALQKYMYDQNVQRLAPYVSAGQTGLTNLQSLAQATPETLGAMYQASPGYNWQLGQGTQAIAQQAAALGGVNSGRTLKALEGYGQGLANQDYNQWLSNYYNMNMGLAGMGANAAGMQAGLGANTAGVQGENLMGAGNAQAAGIVGGYNALGGLANNVANYSLLSQMYGGGMGGGLPPVDYQSTYYGQLPPVSLG